MIDRQAIAQIGTLLKQGRSIPEIAGTVGLEIGDVETVLAGAASSLALGLEGSGGGGVSVVGPFPFDHSAFKTDGDAVVLWTPPAGTIVLDIFFRSDTFVQWAAGDVPDGSQFAVGPGSPDANTDAGWWDSNIAGYANYLSDPQPPPGWVSQAQRDTFTGVMPPQVSDGTTIKVVNSNGDGSATAGYADVLFVVQLAAPVVP